MSETKRQHWAEWTDEEILAEVHRLRKGGFGRLTIEVFEHKVRTLTPAPELRKTAFARTDCTLIRA